MPTPIEVIHAALMHTGKVLFIAEAYGANTLIWDPEDPVEATAFRVLSGTATGLGTVSLACSGNCFLSDGKLLAVGGDSTARRTAWKFNPATERWEPAGTMAFGRWYPTCVKLGDDSGRVLVVSGSDVANSGTPNAVAQMEIFNESALPGAEFTRVWGPTGPGDTAADRSFTHLFPGLHLLPNGEIFHSRVGDRAFGTDRSAKFTFTALDRGQWTDVTDATTDADRTNGMSVLLLKQTPTDPDRVLVVGGGGFPTATTIAVIDVPASPTAMWLTGTFPDGLQRNLVNAVVLPDNSVLITGGLPASGTPLNGGASMLYRPPTGPGLGTLAAMDVVQYERQHHSTALLLPSGKVMVTGGGSQTIEVFSPPYLFDAGGVPLPESARPDITSFPDPDSGTIVMHGATFTVGTSSTANLDRVVLVKPIACTHQTDTEQRVIRLVHTVTGPTTIDVTAPDGRVYPYGAGAGHTHAIAGRAYYMLFLINTSGVPSRAKFIRLV
jgi:hypothetical protein